jgi:threonine dehydrogenase-like Zn-dependent dehydrogenase
MVSEKVGNDRKNNRAKVLGAKRVIAIDTIPERLAMAKNVIGVETIDFKSCDVVETMGKMLNGSSLDVAIECVGFDFPQSWLHKLQMKLGGFYLFRIKSINFFRI